MRRSDSGVRYTMAMLRARVIWFPATTCLALVALAPPATAGRLVAKALPVECVAKQGDAKKIKGSEVDLVKASVSPSPVVDPNSQTLTDGGLPPSAGRGLRFRWEIADYLDSDSHAVFRMTLSGKGGVRYVVAWDDTKKFGRTLVSDAKGKHLRDTQLGGGGLDMAQIQIDVPIKELKKLRGEVRWIADVTVRGRVSDRCSNGASFATPPNT